MGPMVVFSVTDAVGFGSLAYCVDMVKYMRSLNWVKWNQKPAHSPEPTRKCSMATRWNIKVRSFGKKMRREKRTSWHVTFGYEAKYLRTSNDRLQLLFC